MSLWLCLRLPALPLECLPHNDRQAAVVLEQQRVCCANDCAAGFGIRPGMGTATVRALAEPEPVQLLERNTQAEQRALEQLCCWAYSITPRLHPRAGNCLLLEIGACLKLFRGLSPLLDEARAGLARRGYCASTGLAPTPQAAWLLSHADADSAMAHDSPLEQRLGALPLSLLEADFTAPVRALRRAGVEDFSALLQLPARALARRCGRDFTHCLDQVLGREGDLQEDYQPPRRFSDSYWFGYEVKTNEELLPAIQHLLQSLCLFLHHTQLRAGEVEWQLNAVDRSVRRLKVRSSSCQSDWRSWYALTRLHLDRLQLEEGVEGLSLHCDRLESGELPPADLFADAGRREPLGSLLDRLRSRLGLQAVQRVGSRDEHLPEYSVRTGSEGGDFLATGAAACQHRPFWLLPEPRPLSPDFARGGELTLLQGPERIEDNWWRQPVCRDYYIARGPAGEIYWVFFDRRGGNWFMHGIFA